MFILNFNISSLNYHYKNSTLEHFEEINLVIKAIEAQISPTTNHPKKMALAHHKYA
jgi:hypothetical protein